ncbi:MAG: choice-of-anchor Q domain-containing protein, partial [Rhodanobacteraceae bacterium]
MTRFSLLAVLFAGFCGHAVAGSVTHIASGDCQGLNSAVASATSDAQSTIILARGGTYNACSLFVLHGSVLVEGSGATIRTDLCVATLVTAGPSAQLTLRNTHVSTADCGSPLPGPETAVISNAGSMELDSVTITAPLVRNDSRSTLILRNVTMWGSIKNSGALSIFNSTMVPLSIETEAGSQLNLSNSILWLMGGSMGNVPRCPVSGSGIAHSLGGNLLGSGCNWAAASDRISPPFPELANSMKDNGGLVPTSALASSSFARGIGVARYCEATDARGATRVPGTCDAGAYEFDGGSQKVTAGGMNGSFHD